MSEVTASRPEVRDGQVTVDGLRLHYREWGAREAPPLLLLHGLTGHAWEFDAVAAALAEHYRVLVPNQRGHGASDWSAEYSPEQMAADIAGFIDALSLGRVRVVGHSMGGVNSWLFAARYPERVERLAIIDIDPETITSPGLAPAWQAVLNENARARYASRPDAVAAYLADYTGSHREVLRDFIVNNVVRNADGEWAWRYDAAGLRQWMAHASANIAVHREALEEIACPVLVIRAGDSPFTRTGTARRMARTIPQGRFHEIPRTGHDIHIEQPQALLAVLLPFLEPDAGRKEP